MFKKDESNIEIRIKYFNKNELENIEDEINSFTEELYSDNNSFDIKSKKVDKKLGLWFLKYTFGTNNDLMYNFYLERSTAEYRLTIRSFNFDISLKDIEFLYSQISKYPASQSILAKD